LEDISAGLQRFVFGLAKKIILADTFGILADNAFSSSSLSTGMAWIGALAYTMQIYYDFSGYSDMAIGLGRIFGFRFFENFNYPYISRSITEFWRRWHISLGTFFRDYVYIPLGGNRVSLWKNIRNIMVVWLLTGFWHGASWNFLVWGLYYGLLLLAEKFLFRRIKEKLPAVINLAITLVLVLIGWVFFYYENLFDGLQHLGIMFGITGAAWTDPAAVYYFKHYFLFLASAALACVPWKQLTSRLPAGIAAPLGSIGSRLKPVVVSILFLASLAMIITQSYNPFLYFRF